MRGNDVLYDVVMESDVIWVEARDNRWVEGLVGDSIRHCVERKRTCQCESAVIRSVTCSS
jgi:hypothetical protein